MNADYKWWAEGLEEYIEWAGVPNEQPGINNHNRCRELLEWLREQETSALSAELARREVGECPRGFTLVDRAALGVAINMLRRDEEAGKSVRGEVADLLERGQSFASVRDEVQTDGKDEAATPAPVGPGMVVVPREPTIAMTQAALVALRENNIQTGNNELWVATYCWNAMLAAATPPGEEAK